MNKIPIEPWATLANVDVNIARSWAKEGLLEGAQKSLFGDWKVPLKTGIPALPVLLALAKRLFREKFFEAITRYDESVRVGDEPPLRARWSKEEVMEMCQWSYPNSWRTLRDVLEAKIGLIMLLQGARSEHRGAVKPWTFATCQEDRELSIIHATRCQIGGMKRTAKVVAQALAPPDEKYALDEGSKTRIDEVLDKQGVKLDNILQTLQDVKQNLLDRDTMKLLEEYNER